MSILSMIPGVSALKMIGVGFASALITASLASVWTNLVVVPAAKKEAAQIAQSQMLEKFKEASNEIASDAEKFRANRLACRAAGGVFDFSTGDCRQG